jgi:hypothetical protein
VRGLVRVDAGVLDQAEAGAADVGVLVGGDLPDSGGAVEADVEVAGAGDFDRGDAWHLELAFSSAASSVAMARGALRRRLASSKATGRASSPRAMFGGCSTAKLRQGNVVLGEQSSTYRSTHSSSSFLLIFSSGVWATWMEPGPSRKGSPHAVSVGNVGGELGDHGGQLADAAHAHAGQVEREADLAAARDHAGDGVLDLIRRADGADQQVRLGLVGDDVGRVAAFDEADVQRRRPDLRLDGQRHGEHIVQRLHQLVDRRLAQLRVGGVRHAAMARSSTRSAPLVARARRLSVGSPLMRKREPRGLRLATLAPAESRSSPTTNSRPTLTPASRSRSAAATCAAMMPLASHVPRP